MATNVMKGYARRSMIRLQQIEEIRWNTIATWSHCHLSIQRKKHIKIRWKIKKFCTDSQVNHKEEYFASASDSFAGYSSRKTNL